MSTTALRVGERPDRHLIVFRSIRKLATLAAPRCHQRTCREQVPRAPGGCPSWLGSSRCCCSSSRLQSSVERERKAEYGCQLLSMLRLPAFRRADGANLCRVSCSMLSSSTRTLTQSPRATTTQPGGTISSGWRRTTSSRRTYRCDPSEAVSTHDPRRSASDVHSRSAVGALEAACPCYVHAGLPDRIPLRHLPSMSASTTKSTTQNAKLKPGERRSCPTSNTSSSRTANSRSRAPRLTPPHTRSSGLHHVSARTR